MNMTMKAVIVDQKGNVVNKPLCSRSHGDLVKGESIERVMENGKYRDLHNTSKRKK